MEEPLDRRSVDACARETFSNDQLEEMRKLYNNWGRKPGAPPFEVIDRVRFERIMHDEIEACRRRHTDADDGHIQAAALVALNILRSTQATGTNGGGSMLNLFRKAIDSEITREVTPQKRSNASSFPPRGGPISKIELARRVFKKFEG